MAQQQQDPKAAMSAAAPITPPKACSPVTPLKACIPKTPPKARGADASESEDDWGTWRAPFTAFPRRVQVAKAVETAESAKAVAYCLGLG